MGGGRGRSGGSQATELAGKLGLDTRFVQGRRVTDAATREVATMTLNGSVNTGIVAVCRQLGVPALGISGVDAGLVHARRRPPVEIEGEGEVDYGYVGDIESVNAGALERIL
ncbi:MAG: acetylglutamate kinase, partial [Bosea sp.]|nr:acetylglutamate kinase [Bosea sp. (in: a-proteobacteria)]